MSNQYQYANVFARVLGGVVVEYPLTEMDIRQRGVSELSSYFPTMDKGEEELRPYHRLQYQFTIDNKVVKVDKIQTPLSIDEILQIVHRSAASKDPNSQAVDPASVDPYAFAEVSRQVETIIMDQLNALVKSERYDSVDSAASFVTSHVEKFREQAQYVLWLRSELFVRLEEYEQAVATGVKPVPRTSAEIFSELPAVVWSKELLAKYNTQPTKAIDTKPEEKTEEVIKETAKVTDPLMDFLKK